MLKFSIIIPTFNSEKFLERTLNSIIEQTYGNYEVIICDNQSIDNTIKIINKFQLDNKKIKLIIRKDVGVADALNFGFENSSGDILCWLNSDDYYFDNNVLSDVEKKIKDYDYLVGNFINIDEHDELIKYFYAYIPFKKVKKLFFYNQIFTGALFFKNYTFKKFDTNFKFSFEYDLLFFIFKNYNGIYLDKFLACFRILPNALSSNKKELKEEFFELINRYNLFYSNNIFLRIFSYIRHKTLHKVIKSKIKYLLK